MAFDLYFSDLHLGRYLEMWLPANLIFDEFAVRLEIEDSGTAVPHIVVTNGYTTATGFNGFIVEFPADFAAFSPMLLIAAADALERRASTMTLPGGVPLHLELAKQIAAPDDLATVDTDLRGYLTRAVQDVGPYLHGERFVAYLWQEGRSMEYDGATTSSTGALEHEAFHSWHGRGLKPATQADARSLGS